MEKQKIKWVKCKLQLKEWLNNIFKIGDKVRVIKENLHFESTDEYIKIKEFLKGYNDFFEVSYIYKYNDSLLEIKKPNGKSMTFFENELEKVGE